MKTIKFAAAAVAATLIASSAGAATLSLVGGGYQDYTISGYDLMPNLNGAEIKFLSGDVKNSTNGLSVSGPAKVTYTYVGSEADNVNYSASIADAWLITEATSSGSSVVTNVLSGGLLNFLFGTIAPTSALGQILNHDGAIPNSANFAIGYYQSGSSWYAMFDDLANVDRDFDDFVLKIDVAPIPLPAAGFLLLGGLGALGAMSRRRKSA